jgi:ribonucleoside-diphosphate reductase alpha chain
MFKSNRNPQFRSKFSEDIFNTKYAHEGAETLHELASTLVEDVLPSQSRGRYQRRLG